MTLFDIDYKLIKPISKFKLKEDLSNIGDIIYYYIHSNASSHKHLLIKSILYKNYGHTKYTCQVNEVLYYSTKEFNYLVFHNNIKYYHYAIWSSLYLKNVPVIIDIRNLNKKSYLRNLFKYFVNCTRFKVKQKEINSFTSNYKKTNYKVQYVYLNNTFDNISIPKKSNYRYITNRKNIYFIVDDYTFKYSTLYTSMLLLYLKNKFNIIGKLDNIGKVYTKTEINSFEFYIYNYDIEFDKFIE